MKPNISIVLLKDPQVRLEAQYVPNETEYKRTATNSKVMIVGRSNPKTHYTGGDSKLTLSFDFCANTFFADFGKATLSEAAIKQDVETKVYAKTRMAESFAFGQDVKLIFGDMWRDSVWVVDDVSIANKDHTSKKFGHLPLRATVTFSLSLNPKKSILAEDLR